jgi:hypothetical protein
MLTPRAFQMKIRFHQFGGVAGLNLELVAKPHRHFFNVIMMQANWKKATNIPI